MALSEADKLMLHQKILDHLNPIAKMFRRPLITVVVRSDELADGDLMVTNDPDLEAVVASVRNLGRKEPI